MSNCVLNVARNLVPNVSRPVPASLLPLSLVALVYGKDRAWTLQRVVTSSVRIALRSTSCAL